MLLPILSLSLNVLVHGFHARSSCPVLLADGAMALVTSALAAESNLQTPRDVIRILSCVVIRFIGTHAGILQ